MSQKKALSLDEFKKEFESDASKRAKVQENVIREQRKKIDELKAICEKQAADLYVLFKRCKTSWGFYLCGYCGLKETCKQRLETKVNKKGEK